MVVVETVVEEKKEDGGGAAGREGESDIPEGGGGGGSRGKPKRERGERSRLEERLRALRHRSHLPTCDKTVEASAEALAARDTEFINSRSRRMPFLVLRPSSNNVPQFDGSGRFRDQLLKLIRIKKFTSSCTLLKRI